MLRLVRRINDLLQQLQAGHPPFLATASSRWPRIAACPLVLRWRVEVKGWPLLSSQGMVLLLAPSRPLALQGRVREVRALVQAAGGVAVSEGGEGVEEVVIRWER